MSHSLPSPREVLAENLSILGFKPRNCNNAHYSGVVLNQDAFSGASNTKAFELISWFLFNKLDSHKAKKSFAHCWPIVDYRSQPREYRSTAYKWLEELKKENRLLGDIVLRRSYLEDCRGERIEKIMMALSTLVLKTVMERNNEDLYEPMISINTNDSSNRQIMALEEATMKATKIVAMLETKQHQAKSEWEIKEHKVLRKLERLDLYQQKQVQNDQTDGSGMPHYILRLTSNSSASQMERQILQRLDTLDALWEKCADELVNANHTSSEIDETSLERRAFQIDTLSHLWLETWEAVRRIQSEASRQIDIDKDNRLIGWAERQTAYSQRRALKAQAIKNMLQTNHIDGDIQRRPLYRRKRAFHETQHDLHARISLMPSLKRARSSEDRVQDIRDMIYERVDARAKEGDIMNQLSKPQSYKATSELLPPLLKLSPKENSPEMYPDASEAKIIKPAINYDRNGRRIRPVVDEDASAFRSHRSSHVQVPIDPKSNPAVVHATTHPTSNRLFKENTGRKVERATSGKSSEKTTKASTPAYAVCDEIIEQMNNPPLSMITPPRSYSPKQIPHHASSNFESPSYSKYREYKRKLSSAVDIGEPQCRAATEIDLSSDQFFNDQNSPERTTLNLDVESGSNIFDDFPENGAQSTPQRHSTKDVTFGPERSILSVGSLSGATSTPKRNGIKDLGRGMETTILSAAAASPGSTSLVAYNAAIDDTSVYLFGENLPDNFDDGVDMTL